MGENCKDCIYYINLKEAVDKQQKDIDTLKTSMGKLETSVATEKERVNNIFSILKEIKNSIDKISNTIDGIRLKPAAKWETLTGDIIKTIVAIVIGVMMGKLIK